MKNSLLRINPEKKSVLILDNDIPKSKYCEIDLSHTNKELENILVSDHRECQKYVNTVLQRTDCSVAYGGYLEKRKLYSESSRFSEGKIRNIHLGMDFWCEAGTAVIAPLAGKVHSFGNNSDYGNYGPTLILEHSLSETTFYSLYGHLSIESLSRYQIDKTFKKGDILGWLGTPDINVGYAPHLHFQLIYDLERFYGDYPGVCNETELSFYRKNCPDPNTLFLL